MKYARLTNIFVCHL
jgi:hypothetical protein